MKLTKMWSISKMKKVFKFTLNKLKFWMVYNSKLSEPNDQYKSNQCDQQVLLNQIKSCPICCQRKYSMNVVRSSYRKTTSSRTWRANSTAESTRCRNGPAQQRCRENKRMQGPPTEYTCAGAPGMNIFINLDDQCGL